MKQSIELSPKEQAEMKINNEVRALKEKSQEKIDFCDEAALIAMRSLIEKQEDGKYRPNPKRCYETAQGMWEEHERVVEAEKQRIRAEEAEIIRRNKV